MTLSGFDTEQKKALLKLLVLGMYSDGHLAASEDARIQKLLNAMEFSSHHSRDAFADACITEMSRRISPQAASSLLTELGKELSSLETRRCGAEALENLLFSDERVTDKEREFLANVRNEFGL